MRSTNISKGKYRYAIVALSAGLLPLSGCHDNDVKKEVVLVKSVSSDPKTAFVNHVVRQGTVMVLESASQFSLRFVSSAATCDGAQDQSGLGYFTASLVSGTHQYPYRLTCKVIASGSSPEDLSYELVDAPPKHVPTDGRVTPCNGCIQGTDPNAGK